jgi:hypothetical protein
LLAAGALVKDWNTIVTIYPQGFKRAMRALQKIGPTERTTYQSLPALHRRSRKPFPLFDIRTKVLGE